jgi:hypothetical protein
MKTIVIQSISLVLVDGVPTPMALVLAQSRGGDLTLLVSALLAYEASLKAETAEVIIQLNAADDVCAAKLAAAAATYDTQVAELEEKIGELKTYAKRPEAERVVKELREKKAVRIQEQAVELQRIDDEIRKAEEGAEAKEPAAIKIEK